MISVATLISVGVEPTQARVFAEPLARAFGRFDIVTPTRIAAFIAQAAHESVNFTRLEENLRYTNAERVARIFSSRVAGPGDAATLLHDPQKLANRVYANKNGNGDETSGDGWKFRGRGLFQLTGRANYDAAAAALGEPYVEHPDLVQEPAHACLTAAWYWSSIDGNALADTVQIDKITRRVNGPAMLARNERRSRYDDAMRELV